jgi:hypothetical protein
MEYRSLQSFSLKFSHLRGVFSVPIATEKFLPFRIIIHDISTEETTF